MTSDVSSRSFQMKSEILIGVWGECPNKFLRSEAGRRRELFQKFIKPALLADAKKQRVAAPALLAKAASVYTLALLADAVCKQTNRA